MGSIFGMCLCVHLGVIRSNPCLIEVYSTIEKAAVFDPTLAFATMLLMLMLSIGFGNVPITDTHQAGLTDGPDGSEARRCAVKIQLDEKQLCVCAYGITI